MFSLVFFNVLKSIFIFSFKFLIDRKNNLKPFALISRLRVVGSSSFKILSCGKLIKLTGTEIVQVVVLLNAEISQNKVDKKRQKRKIKKLALRKKRCKKFIKCGFFLFNDKLRLRLIKGS